DTDDIELCQFPDPPHTLKQGTLTAGKRSEQWNNCQPPDCRCLRAVAERDLTDPSPGQKQPERTEDSQYETGPAERRNRPGDKFSVAGPRRCCNLADSGTADTEVGDRSRYGDDGVVDGFETDPGGAEQDSQHRGQ